MKIDKQKEKILTNAVKKESRKRKFRFRQDIVYFVKDKYFISCLFYLNNLNEIKYYVRLKEMVYDDIFWKLMNMEDNLKEPLSLRAIGAFTSKSIDVFNGKILYDEKIDAIAKIILDHIELSISEFIKANDLDDYVLNKNTGPYKDLLKCIVYIKRNELYLAKEIAEKNIDNDKCGGFVNKGKTFFEYVLEYEE